VAVEALKRAGPRPTREAYLAALDGMTSYDAGGYLVGFSPTNHNGSNFVELTVIGGNLKFNY
jgi:ABC-type branched-subunit amino acid transport system substrate-binding protein